MEPFSFYRLLTILSLRQSTLPLHVDVQVEQGALQGIELTSVQDNLPYVGFLGIPYAQPPVGPLRFKAPQPPGPWNGTLYAVRNAAQCLQKFPYSIHPTVDGSEDCLFLNVYTPKVPVSKSDTLLPVMVWIHGGGFEIGSGDKKMYGPDYLVIQDVVVVTFNYRLGAFGFLSFEDSSVPGNAGMKDQVAALRWVKKNIAQFGGDPDNVTIFGESAGGVCVQYHLLSPMSRGLFHKAISQSGSVLNPWSFTTTARKKAFVMGETFGCNSSESTEVVECLRRVPAIHLVDKAHFHTVTEDDKRHGTILPFVPSSEKGVTSEDEVFLTDHPSSLLSKGHFQSVPHIIGFNSHEAILLSPAFATDGVLEGIDKDFERMVPLDMTVTDGDQSHVAARIKEFYFGNDTVSKKTLLNLINLMTDMFYTNGIRRSAQFEANFSSSPVYFYQFSYNGMLGFMKRLMHGNKFPGACHADDLGYLFRIGFWSRVLGPDTPEMITVHRMVKMWTNFAKTGNPSSELDALLNVTWDPLTPNKASYLSIDQELTMQEDVEAQRMAFWDKLYEELNWIPT